MQPWRAEGEVPTAANLNLYRGWKSCVGWHCDDEPLFGKCGDAKLIVSVSLGSTALFRWRRQSCLDGEEHLCCLGHCDILVMDGQCQDEFLHRTDPGREQERINVTFRWVKQHVSSCPQGLSWCLVHMGGGRGLVLLVPVVYKAWVIRVCFLLDTPCGLFPGGGITFVTSGENAWQLMKLPAGIFGAKREFWMWTPYMLALMRQPSLHGYDACMVCWTNGALRRNCRHKQ